MCRRRGPRGPTRVVRFRRNRRQRRDRSLVEWDQAKPVQWGEIVMNLRGSDRLRMLLLGAAAAGVFGQQPGYAAGPAPAVPAAKKPFFHLGKPASPPPQLLPMTEADATIQPVARTENAPASGSGEKKSEVMRQLELLYQQDGREMPELNTDIKPTPVPGPNGAAPATGSKQPTATPAPAAGGIRTQQPAAGQNVRSPQPVPNPAQAAAPNSPATPAAPPAKSKNPVVAFFKKLAPGNKDPKPTAAPAQYRPDVAPVPPGIVQQTAPPLNRVATVSVDSGLPPLDSQPRIPAFGLPPAEALPAPLATLEIPPAPVGDLPVQVAEASLLPPLLVEPMPAGELASLPSPDSGTPAEPTSPFSEMSEAEADKKGENPFTGLTLDEDTGKASPQSAEPAKEAVPSSPPEEDPFADELKKMGIVPPSAEKTEITQGTEPAKATEPANKLAPPSDTPTFDGIEDQGTREKMKKIHERGSMKGLKGFCPVSLREQRELKDAKPEFHSTFRGQKFHFADAESKLKFDEEPARFAPAAYGADVVALTRDKDVVEGSLDFAAWFKGRLYLFGTQESHDTFVANPAAYATPVGIE